MDRGLIRPVRNVDDIVHNLLVIPAGGKLGLAGIAHSMPVATAAVCIAIQDVLGAFRRDAEGVQRRAIPRVYRVPAGIIAPVSDGACWPSLAGTGLPSAARSAS
jgi:hypothetical protein